MRRLNAFEAEGPRAALSMIRMAPTPPRTMMRVNSIRPSNPSPKQAAGGRLQPDYAAFAFGLFSIDFRLSTSDFAPPAIDVSPLALLPAPSSVAWLKTMFARVEKG